MKAKFWVICCLLLVGLSVPLSPAGAAPAEMQFIDPATLKGMLGSPDLVIVDASKGWWTYDQKIPGALVLPGDPSSWAASLPKDKKIVVYCG
jgi:rhodanese-related sulfurtransferase